MICLSRSADCARYPTDLGRDAASSPASRGAPHPLPRAAGAARGRPAGGWPSTWLCAEHPVLFQQEAGRQGEAGLRGIEAAGRTEIRSTKFPASLRRAVTQSAGQPLSFASRGHLSERSGAPGLQWHDSAGCPASRSIPRCPPRFPQNSHQIFRYPSQVDPALRPLHPAKPRMGPDRCSVSSIPILLWTPAPLPRSP